MPDIHEVERNFIYLLLHHMDCVDKWQEGTLSLKHFHSEYRNILNAIEEAYDNNVLLTRRSFLKYIEKIPVPKERISQERLFNACFLSKTDKNDFNSLTDSIIDAYIARELGNGLSEYEEKRKKMRDSEAIHTLIDKLQDSVDSLQRGRTDVIYEDIRNFFDKHKDHISGIRDGTIQEEDKILCGIKEIDDTFTTGFSPGTLFMVCADVSNYKSAMMLNIAVNVWQNGHDVLFATLEMPEEQVSSRMMSMVSHVPLKHIINPKEMTDEEYQKYVETQEKLKSLQSKMYILDMRNERTKVSSIKRIIERQEYNFKPELVVVDYLANLVPDRQRAGRNDLELGDMLKDLRFMGKAMGFSVISGAQLGRDALKRLRKEGVSKDKTSVFSEDIRNSQEIPADSDYILAQFPNVSQPDRLLDICIIKNRNGPKLFEGSKTKESLELFPEIGLIKSKSDSPLKGDLANEFFDSSPEDEWSIQGEDKEDSVISDNDFDDFLEG